MHRTRLFALTLSTLALAACNPFHRDPVTEVTRDLNQNSRWQATLVTPGALAGAVQMRGTATMQPAANGQETRLAVSLTNATPGGEHPWRVHRGQCGADEGGFGMTDAFKPVRIDDKGRGEASATVPGMTPTMGGYHVTVRASAANPETVVACGNLAPPAN